MWRDKERGWCKREGGVEVGEWRCDDREGVYKREAAACEGGERVR